MASTTLAWSAACSARRARRACWCGERSMHLKVGELARSSGLTVRTLHHYDEIGLLKPSGRSDAGYRTYADAELSRLRQILFSRELEFPLAEIAAMLDGDEDRLAHLKRQCELLSARAARLRELEQA